MKKKVLLFVAFFFASSFVFSETLDAKTSTEILNSVYEVVVDKIENEAIEYEKPLPMDRIPFSIRSDKYIPIGTAFRLENGKFYTAAHVIRLYGKSIYKNYYIRDLNNNTYKIEDIESFATDRDFVCFTVPSYKTKEGTGLKVSNSLDLNSTVFSVGNALGEGIIIRDGIYTSQTFEKKDGAWKWIRFSAAASPGNSGGPLVKNDGTVVGIITMKSENENLNYALPISEVLNFEKNKGIVYSRVGYTMPNIFSQHFYDEFKAEVKLPQKLSVLSESLTKEYDEKIRNVVSDIRKDYEPGAAKSFDKTAGSAEKMIMTISPDFSCIFYVGKDGRWEYGAPSNLNTFPLENNGQVVCGGVMNSVISIVKKPDSMSLEKLISNPKLYMSYISKAATLYRNFAGENIHITSLGNPSKSGTYVDYFGRTWLVNYFDFISDSMIVSYAIPVPSGLFVIFQMGSTGSVCSSNYLDVEFLVDNIALPYKGKVKEWKEYLSLPKKYLSRTADFEKSLSMKSDKSNFSFNCDGISANIPSSVISIDDEFLLHLGTGFEKDSKSGKLRYTCNTWGFSKNPKVENYVLYSTRIQKKPASDALEETKESWDQIFGKIAPFDGVPVNNAQYSVLQKASNINTKDLMSINSIIMSCGNNLDVIKDFEQKMAPCVKYKSAGN